MGSLLEAHDLVDLASLDHSHQLQHSPFVARADEADELPRKPARQTRLNQTLVRDAAERTAEVDPADEERPLLHLGVVADRFERVIGFGASVRPHEAHLELTQHAALEQLTQSSRQDAGE